MKCVSSIAAAMLCALAIVGSLACGKKGIPLPPLEGSIPRIADLAVEQVGDEARASFSLPLRPEAEGVDYVTTAIELWRRPSEPGASAGADLEASGDVSEFTRGASLVAEASGPGLFDLLAMPRPFLSDGAPTEDGAALHEYALVLRTNLRKRGTLSNVVGLELSAPPDTPTGFEARPRETGVLLTWTAPSPPPVQEYETDEAATPPADEEEATEAIQEGQTPPPPPRFNLYRAIADRPFAPEPLNESPIRETQWEDGDVAEGVRYRYRVRSVVEVDQREVLSRASEEVVVDYRDEFPPAVPTGLRLIPDGSRSVNVLWAPNDERDLAGYAVVRREPGGDWKRLDPGNLRSASFVDHAVTPGGSYEYAVFAFDGSRPPNSSEPCAARSVTLPATGP